MSVNNLGTNELSQPPSPSKALVVLPHVDENDSSATSSPEWRPILSDVRQVVLYNSASHAVTVRPHNAVPAGLRGCPYCHRPLDPLSGDNDLDEAFSHHPTQHARAPNYFQLLEIANETSSRPASPGSIASSESRARTSSSRQDSGRGASSDGFRADSMAEGYFKAFFKEEYRLGMGANGSVFLCQHVLDGNPLGHFAVKKIAVGQSHTYLLNILREVRLLEQLRHPNIITYHHAWLETHQFSNFGPKVPTLFVLMQWAEGGSLDDFIDARLGRPHTHGSDSYSESPNPSLQDVRSRSNRIRAFRAAQARPHEDRERRREERARGLRTAVHLLSGHEVKGLFGDVVSGLAFLHDKSILHLDLKPGNVLLTWDEDALIPRAMLSDFGTSRDMIQPARHRSGNTGTLEYTAPESLPSPTTGLLGQVDSKADMWSLGMILHMLLFFRLPYHNSSDGSRAGQSHDDGDLQKLEREVHEYPGFRRSASLPTIFDGRGLPQGYIVLLESLLNRLPKKRPTSEQILRAIKEGQLDPVAMVFREDLGEGTIVPRLPSPREVFYSTVEHATAQLESHNNSDHEEPPDYSDDDEHHIHSDRENESRAMKRTRSSPPLLTLEPPTPIAPQPLPGIEVTKQLALLRPVLMLWMKFWNWTTISRQAAIRGVKSLLLISKIFMLLSVCPASRPEPVFTCFMLGLAVSDTWSEDLWLTVLLSFLHVVILRFHCPEQNCCADIVL